MGDIDPPRTGITVTKRSVTVTVTIPAEINFLVQFHRKLLVPMCLGALLYQTSTVCTTIGKGQLKVKHNKKLQTTSKYCSTVSNSKKYQALTRNFTHKKHGSKPPIYSEAIEMDLFAGILR